MVLKPPQNMRLHGHLRVLDAPAGFLRFRGLDGAVRATEVHEHTVGARVETRHLRQRAPLPFCCMGKAYNSIPGSIPGFSSFVNCLPSTDS